MWQAVEALAQDALTGFSLTKAQIRILCHWMQTQCACLVDIFAASSVSHSGEFNKVIQFNFKILSLIIFYYENILREKLEFLRNQESLIIPNMSLAPPKANSRAPSEKYSIQCRKSGKLFSKNRKPSYLDDLKERFNES